MKKIVLSFIILIGTISSLAAISLIRFSKKMEDWEMSWDDETEEQ